jgi:hypothetical protein
MPTSLTGWCLHCRGRIAVPAGLREVTVECPHCGREVDGAAAVEFRQRFHRNRRRIWLGIGLVLVMAAGVSGYIYRSRLRVGFDFLVDETGGNTAAVLSLMIALLALVWVALWFLFPILMYIGLKDLRRRASELEETTKLCARHLARLSGDRQSPPQSKGVKVRLPPGS